MKLINISTATFLLLFSIPAHALTLTEAINASLANNLSIKIENINVNLVKNKENLYNITFNNLSLEDLDFFNFKSYTQK